MTKPEIEPFHKILERIELERQDKKKDASPKTNKAPTAKSKSRVLKAVSWKELHQMPRDWSGHQLKHLLNADEGLKEKNGGKIVSTYPTDALPLGALTLGKGKPSSKAGLLCYGGDSHLLTVAPTRSGKGTTQIIPALLTYEGSSLVIDIKGENHAITARHRSSFVNGAKVFKFAPYETDSMNYNPLDAIRGGDSTFGDCRYVAELMMPQQTQGDNFWTTEARNLLGIILFYVKTSPTIDDENRNMKTVLKQTFAPAGLDDTLNGFTDENELFEIRQLAGVFSSYDEKVKSGVLASLNSELFAWKEPQIEQATRKSDFSFEMLKQDKHCPLTIYICIPPEKLRSARNILRTLVGLAIHNMTRTDVKPKQQVLFMLDEFPSLGYMPPILDGLAYLAGYGAKLWIFAQSLSQLRATYGDAWQLFPNSAAAFSAFNVNDMETANYLSGMLGDTDEYMQKYMAPTEREKYASVIWPDTSKGRTMQESINSENRFLNDGYVRVDDGSHGKTNFVKTIEELKKNYRFTRDNVGPVNLIRQLGDKFALIQLIGEKPAIVIKVPYYERPEFEGKYDKWQN